jgi:hypothetical protein
MPNYPLEKIGSNDQERKTALSIWGSYLMQAVFSMELP